MSGNTAVADTGEGSFTGCDLRLNQRWSMDFVSDTFRASFRFRILAVNDDCRRESLALIADTSISGDRVTRELDALVRLYGKPESIVTDNGTEFTIQAALKWARESGVEWHKISFPYNTVRAVRAVRGRWRQ